MRTLFTAFVAFLACFNTVNGSRILRGKPCAPQAAALTSKAPATPATSSTRRLSQVFTDQPLLGGTNIYANQGFSRMSTSGMEALVANDAQAAARAGDTTYLSNTAATYVLGRQSMPITEDILRNDVQATTGNAATNGNAQAPNDHAGGSTAIWTTAVLRANEDLRQSLATDWSQAGIQAGMDQPSDVFRATTTAKVHADSVAMPTGFLNW